MKTVLGYLRPHAGRVAAGAAIKFTAAVLELILPLLLAEIIDELVPAGFRCPKCGHTHFSKESDIMDVPPHQ